ncbi:MAG: NAD(P)H-dependent oxidoreductase [Flavobacteriaceae bacterium]|nr:NAD(P)H-dependent oxidoreductase [Flavobacteriaceae bacterium]
MKKILAMGASNSSTSINQQLAIYAANEVSNALVEVVDFKTVDLPIYSIDIEVEQGFPAQAQELLKKVRQADGVVVSLAEHNGSYAAVFKNAIDWLSRIEMKFWAEKPMLLLATSPGANGAGSVFKAAKAAFPYLGADIVASYSLPKFYDNFKDGTPQGELAKELEVQIQQFATALHA